jgi:hypothetical protein
MTFLRFGSRLHAPRLRRFVGAGPDLTGASVAENISVSILGLLLCFSLAGAVVEHTLRVSPPRQDTLTITREGTELTGVLRLNGVDLPLTNVSESNGFVSFSTGFPLNDGKGPGDRPMNGRAPQSTFDAPAAQPTLDPREPENPSISNRVQASTRPMNLTDAQLSRGSVPPNSQNSSALPVGRIYGERNTNSRYILRIHRPVQLTVSGPRNRILLQRPLQPGDSYRVPNLPIIMITTPDAGAVEVNLDGTSLGFLGADGTSARRLPLRRFVASQPESERAASVKTETAEAKAAWEAFDRAFQASNAAK